MSELSESSAPTTSSRVPPTERRIAVQHESNTDSDSSEVIGLLKANTSLAVWLVFLAIGGGLLALYYAKIGYLPDIEWNSTLVYLAAASIIGAGVGIPLAMSILLPGIIWSDFLLHDAGLSNGFCLDKENRKEPCVRTVMKYLGVPFAVVLIVSHFALLLGSFWYWVVSSLALAAAFVLMRRVFHCIMLGKAKTLFQSLREKEEISAPDSSGTNFEPRRYTFMYAFWFDVSLLLSQISMFLIFLISDSPRRWYDFAYRIITCTVGVLISCHVVALRYRYHQRQAIAAALFAVAVLVFTADQFAPISLRVMSYYGIGAGSTAVDILINEKDVQIVKELGLTRCTDSDGRKLRNVKILSKLGDDYFIRCYDHAFTLPKSMVVSIEGYTSSR